MLLLICLAILAAPQTAVDAVLVRFGGEIVTRLDVRQARILKLVDVADDSDQAYADALVNRRLMLSELKRNPPADPAPGDVEARRSEWARRLGGDVEQQLARAGMSEAGLRGWLRDDLLLQAYLADRFNGRVAERDAWIATLRQRVGM